MNTNDFTFAPYSNPYAVYSYPYSLNNNIGTPISYHSPIPISFMPINPMAQHLVENHYYDLKEKKISPTPLIDLANSKTLIITENIYCDKKQETKRKLSDFNIHKSDSPEKMNDYLKHLAKMHLEGKIQIVKGKPVGCQSLNNQSNDLRSRRNKIANKVQIQGYCILCGATESPEWRNGVDGKTKLCNACGIYYRKELKNKNPNGKLSDQELTKSYVDANNINKRLKIEDLLN